jgi:hypothetical protein
MKRYTSLFLAVIILLCYSGFRLDAFASIKPATGKVHASCHASSNDDYETKSDQASHRLNKPHGIVSSSCCFKNLTSTSPDLNAKIEIISIDRTQPAILNNGRDYLKKLRDNSLREHDPPDLQISNSTFLL